ncbi:MAG TPA: DNA repair protein RadC [Thermomicrobiales bacterium]|jgi:DNA repair protein RadC|nr:DNA repair protein RadC [Thermomicrobiales bacterium]
MTERRHMLAEMPEAERPRERLLRHGPSALSNIELLAILLNTGLPGESVMVVAERLLREFGGFPGLMKLSAEELARIHGIGPAKATKLKASMEIANRILASNPNQKPKISSPDDITNLIGLEMSLLEQEQLRIVLLNTRNEVIGIRTLYQGTTNQAQVRIAEVFRDAVRANAVAIIVVHNHPTGDPTPSSADIELTRSMVEAGEMLEIRVLDHMIIGHGRHVSMKRLGLGFSGPNGR